MWMVRELPAELWGKALERTLFWRMWTQQGFAARVGISRRTVSRAVHGRCSTRTRVRIEKHLGAAIETLLPPHELSDLRELTREAAHLGNRVADVIAGSAGTDPSPERTSSGNPPSV